MKQILFAQVSILRGTSDVFHRVMSVIKGLVILVASMFSTLRTMFFEGDDNVTSSVSLGQSKPWPSFILLSFTSSTLCDRRIFYWTFDCNRYWA